MGFMRCHNWIVAMVMWTLALCFYGISVGGVVTNQVDVVPHFAGGVHVITHMLTGLLSLPLPYIITAITSSVRRPLGYEVADTPLLIQGDKEMYLYQSIFQF